MQDTPTTSRWVRRGFLGLPLALWALIATAATALAVVGFVVFLQNTGTVATGDGIDITYELGSESAESNTSVGTCEITASSDSLALTATGMLATEYCYFTVEVNNAGPEDAVFARFSLQPSGTNGIDARVATTVHGDFCETPIPAGGSAVIGFQIDFLENTVPGFSHVMTDPNEDNLKFVRSDIYTEGDCF